MAANTITSILQRNVVHIDMPNKTEAASKSQAAKAVHVDAPQKESEALDAYTHGFLDLVQKSQNWLKEHELTTDVQSKVKIEAAKQARYEGRLDDPMTKDVFSNDLPIQMPTP